VLPAPFIALFNAIIAPVTAPAATARHVMRTIFKSANRLVDVQPKEIGPGQILKISHNVQATTTSRWQSNIARRPCAPSLCPEMPG